MRIVSLKLKKPRVRNLSFIYRFCRAYCNTAVSASADEQPPSWGGVCCLYCCACPIYSCLCTTLRTKFRIHNKIEVDTLPFEKEGEQLSH